MAGVIALGPALLSQVGGSLHQIRVIKSRPQLGYVDVLNYQISVINWWPQLSYVDVLN